MKYFIQTNPLLISILFLCLFALGVAKAEWVQQEIMLRPGWNSVWLEVTPEENDIDVVFQEMPVSTVWRHYVEEASARYVDDSALLKPESAKWLTWSPGAGSGASNAVRNLNAVHGGWCYLIHVEGDEQVLWAIEGRPILRDLNWLSRSYTLAGLPVNPENPVTFSEYFSQSSAHPNLDVRQLNGEGQWTSIPSTTPIVRGEAYWIYSQGISSFQGPGGVEIDGRGVLDFGSELIEQQITLVNNQNVSATFVLSLLESSPANLVYAGSLELELWRDGSNGEYGWEDFNGPKTIVLEPNSKRTIRMAIRRRDMTGLGEEFSFASILRVQGIGIREDIGMRADGFSGNQNAVLYAGLWAGTCVLREVNEPAGENPNLLQPVETEAAFRVLVRVHPDGSSELLREAYIFWVEGLSDEEGNLTEAGRFVVAGSEEEISNLETLYGALGVGRLKGALVREGVSIPRRLSTIGFSFTEPQVLTGSFGTSGNSLNGIINIGYDDDLNPYKHRYHPDHDNWKNGSVKEGNPEKLSEGKESFTIVRKVQFDFAGQDPENLNFAGFGDRVVGGEYSETITGLHRDPIKVAGSFRLNKVAGE